MRMENMMFILSRILLHGLILRRADSSKVDGRVSFCFSPRLGKNKIMTRNVLPNSHMRSDKVFSQNAAGCKPMGEENFMSWRRQRR